MDELINDRFLPPYTLRRQIYEPVQEWYRWGTEFAAYLKLLCNLNLGSHVLEIGCNVGRNVYAIRDAIGQDGSYHGIDIQVHWIDFLKSRYSEHFPNFRFTYVDLHNTRYNPAGKLDPSTFQFPCPDESVDIVFAASVFTHMNPVTTAHYFKEVSRTLKPQGRFLCTFFVKDHYRGVGTTAFGSGFEFDFPYPGFEDTCAVTSQDNLEFMTAHSLDAIRDYAKSAELIEDREHLPGRWSGSFQNPVNDQEVFVFRRTP